MENDNSDSQPLNDRRLSKNEIIRGHVAYLKVLQNPVLISTEFLKAFINKQIKLSDLPDLTVRIRSIGESPLFTHNVKVGFIVAKKKIRKAVLRNRVRRLLKEAYRLDKDYRILPVQSEIIFSLTDKGYAQFNINPRTKLEFVSGEMKKLQLKIKSQFTRQ